MSNETSLHNSSFLIHNSTLVPIYHLRGARPLLFDLDNHQSGWTILLILHREGDCCLLPLAWQQDVPGPDDDHLPPASFHANALDSEALELTLTDLKQDGWHVNGRLDVHFTGRHTEANFWQKIQPYLWQKG